MAEEAAKTQLDTLRKRLQGAKDERKIAKEPLSKAKQDLMKVRRASREIIATAEKQHAVAKMDARIREDKERLERLPREGRVRLMLCRLLKVKIAYLEWRSAWTRQTTKRLGKGTGQLDESRKHIEDEQKDVENLLEDKEREEQTPIEDVEKKRRELDTLVEARKKDEEQAENQIREAWETALKKRWAVWIAASRVSSEALKFPWKRVADNITVFGRWAGFAGVAGCFYAYAVLLGAISQFSYFRSNGVNIFSYAETVDLLAPGYGLVTFFILMTVLVILIPLTLYYLVKLILILPLPLYVEILAAVSSFFAKRIPKTSLFVLCCTVWVLFSLLGAAWLRYIWPPSQDCVSIVTDPPFQYQPEYVRIGSTSKYLFLREEAGGCPVPSTAPNNDDGDWDETIKGWLETAWAGLKNIDTWPGIVSDWLLSIWAGDEGNLDPILVVPLSKITCISEIGGNGEGLCKATVGEKIVHPKREPTSFEESVDQYIAKDMGCPPEAPKIERSDFVPFVYPTGDQIDESAGEEPRSREKWGEKIREFVAKWNNKPTKWRVYGLASRDGISDHNNTLSRQRAETVKKMMCDASKTSSRIENCQKKVEVRSLGEDHRVTGPESRSAVIAACVRKTSR